MTVAPVTLIQHRKADPRVAVSKPWKTLSVAFDGNHTESDIIDKSEFSIVELNFPALLSAGDVTIKASMTRVLAEFQVIQDVAIDGSLGAKGTTLAAGYPYIIIVPAVLEAKLIHVALKTP